MMTTQQIVWQDLLRLNLELQGANRPTLFTDFVPQSKSGKFFTESHDAPSIWVWSDLHFYHKNIIKYSNRPFSNVDDMVDKLVASHNSVVQPGDTVIWVGDVAFSNDQRANDVLARLVPAYRILVVGNHDYDQKKKRFKHLNFDEVHSYLVHCGVLFTHYPMSRIPKGFINIHGHLHTKNTNNPRCVNVSVEQIGYKPVLLSDIICRMDTVDRSGDVDDNTYDKELDKNRHGY